MSDQTPPGWRKIAQYSARAKAARIAWSPNGETLSFGDEGGNIYLWKPGGSGKAASFTGHVSAVRAFSWADDGSMFASCSYDGSVKLWDSQTHAALGRVDLGLMAGFVQLLVDANRVLAAHSEGFAVIELNPLRKLTDYVPPKSKGAYQLSPSPDKSTVAAALDNHNVALFRVNALSQPLRLFEHPKSVISVVWSHDGKRIVTSGLDPAIRVWDVDTGTLIAALEGHTSGANQLSMSADGRFFASNSFDRTVRLWEYESLKSVSVLPTSQTRTSQGTSPALAFHPSQPNMVATLGEDNHTVCVWELDYAAIMANAPDANAVYYTTSKIVLVGDSSVGKSGLGYRIAKNDYLNTGSSHGQQFWVVDRLRTTRPDGTVCEAVLWDFAGQRNYRPTHALFLDGADLALVVFDPARSDTLISVDYWLKQIAPQGELCRAILVAARTDVSKLTMTVAELDEFCKARGISGGFVATSAATGAGIDQLMDMIRQQIDWDKKLPTVTTEMFKRIKDFVLALKAQADRDYVLVTPAQLRAKLEATDAEWVFADKEMMDAVEHLETHGYVKVLRRSADEEAILLAPDLLINLAASFTGEAQNNEKGLGALEEIRALRNEYDFPELKGLSDFERDMMLNAVTELFLKRNICFREALDGHTYLIFPSLINERPPQVGAETNIVEDMTYLVTGAVENVYAALVVLLGYAQNFRRTNQWRRQAQYETNGGAICGFKQTSDDPTELDLILYYGKETPEFARNRFQGLFEEILDMHDVTVMRYPPIICPKCDTRQERRTVIRRIRDERPFIICEECGEPIKLPKAGARIRLSTRELVAVSHEQVYTSMRTSYETALVSVKGRVLDQAAPSCFISYAWGNPKQERWVKDNLATDLRNAGFEILLDQWDNAAAGKSISRFVTRIADCTYVIVIGTPAYFTKYKNEVSPIGSVVAAEVDLINVRLLGTEGQKNSVIPLLLEGEERTSFPELLHRRVHYDFQREQDYFIRLFDLVLTMYRIPFDDPAVSDLRARLIEEARNVLEASEPETP